MTIHASLSGPVPEQPRSSYTVTSRRPKMTDNIPATPHDLSGPGVWESLARTGSGVFGVSVDDRDHPDAVASRARFAENGTDDDGYDAMRDRRR